MPMTSTGSSGGVCKKLVQAERGDPIKIGHDDMVSGLGLHLKEDAFGEFV